MVVSRFVFFSKSIRPRCWKCHIQTVLHVIDLHTNGYSTQNIYLYVYGMDISVTNINTVSALQIAIALYRNLKPNSFTFVSVHGVKLTKCHFWYKFLQITYVWRKWSTFLASCISTACFICLILTLICSLYSKLLCCFWTSFACFRIMTIFFSCLSILY